MAGERNGGTRRLGELLAGTELEAADVAGDIEVTGITADSRAVEPGMLFVAIRGTRTDGHAFVPAAVQSGAAAVVVEEDLPAPAAVPVLRVRGARRALAELAASWHGHPAASLSLIGITGTVGKTTVLTMLESILNAAERRPGIVGSLGIRLAGEELEGTAHTSPDPLQLHGSLATLVAHGCALAAMEVTSHALVQERVHGLRYDLGIFTNLIPLEHSEYHRSFRDYAAAKRRFLDHLHGCAPLIYGADDRTVRRLVREAQARAVGCGFTRTALARVEACRTSPAGTRLELHVRRPLPRMNEGDVAPLRLPLELKLLGRSNVLNAAFAATAALSAGVPAAHVASALSAFRAPWRRMQLVHRGEFLVLDDTTGHPDSVTAVFEVVQAFAPARLHVAFAVRGRRGVRVNRQLGEALAIWSERVPLSTLVVTRATDTADERNGVEDVEYAAFREPLRRRGVAVQERAQLADAVDAVLQPARAGDLVLLLGAQGMDAGQGLARDWLRARGAA